MIRTYHIPESSDKKQKRLLNASLRAPAGCAAISGRWRYRHASLAMTWFIVGFGIYLHGRHSCSMGDCPNACPVDCIVIDPPHARSGLCLRLPRPRLPRILKKSGRLVSLPPIPQKVILLIRYSFLRRPARPTRPRPRRSIVMGSGTPVISPCLTTLPLSPT